MCLKAGARPEFISDVLLSLYTLRMPESNVWAGLAQTAGGQAIVTFPEPLSNKPAVITTVEYGVAACSFIVGFQQNEQNKYISAILMAFDLWQQPVIDGTPIHYFIIKKE